MKRILLSVGIIVGVVAAVAGGTGAFFSDTESSTGNTFAAGAIDLLVDNESYYNGAVSTSTSWAAQNLTQGLLFLNFTDLKPDDEGEDTISLHVNDNDAWACMNLVLTSNDDRSSNEPELDAMDAVEDINNTWDGELAQHVQMFWWADDGDNVYETGENGLISGVQTIASMFGGAAATGTLSLTLADSTHNAWGNSGPIVGSSTAYIGKAFCFGTMTLTPLAQDGNGHMENSTNGPLARGGGFSCDGTQLGNDTQTDGLTLDIAFSAIQARHNTAFTCNEQPRTATLTVVKEVINDNGGDNTVPDFQLVVDNGTIALPVTSGVANNVTVGTYTVGETGVSGYVASFSGDCDASGQITLTPGDNKTCIITNNDLPGNITLIKNVINNNGGVAGPTGFGLRVDGNLVPNNTSVAVTSNSPHTINEDGRTGYHFVSITGSAKCPGVLGGTATLDEGEAITCTITNDDD